MMAIASSYDPAKLEALPMAVAVILDRVRHLSKEDRDDLLELVQLLGSPDEEERQAAGQACLEILDQKKVRVIDFPLEGDPTRIQKWLAWISGRLKQAREDANLTQEALASSTGLPQSHISRLENGVHSPSSATLEKIANATGKPVAYFDPNHLGE